jgi:segregation and condensation protein B
MTDKSRCGTLVYFNRSGAMVMRLVPQAELLSEQEIRELEAQEELETGRVRDDSEELNEAQLDGAITDDAADAADADNDGDGADSSSDSNGHAAASEPAADLALLEALLLSTHSPLTAGRLAELLDLDSTKPVRKAIKSLNEQYSSGGRAFRVEQVAGGYQLLTLPEFGEALKKLHQKEADAKLTKAALESLAIIAYKQPILRAEVEAIRGCACGETIRSLMEKHLVKIAGRAEEPGRPILYGTTKRFLELFGLNSLRDLPQPEGAKPEARNG